MKYITLTLTLTISGLVSVVYAATAQEYVPGELIIKFKDTLDITYTPTGFETQYDSINKLNGEFGVYRISPLFDFLPTKPIDDPNGKWRWEDWLDVMRKYRYDTYYVFEYNNDKEPPAAAKVYMGDAAVDFAEPDYIAELCFIPNDEHFSLQWNFRNYGQIPPGGSYDCDIDAPEGWNYWPLSFREPVVAVVDTGCQLNHPDLTSNLVTGRNFVNPEQPPGDSAGHGTHVAGIIAAETNNSLGVAGVGYNHVKVMPCKVGTYGVFLEYCATAILWAALNGADVENFSWGSTDDWLTIHKAVEGAYELGVVMCAGAGNEGNAEPFYPAWYKEVISVTAIDCDWNLAYYSSWGIETECTAPGGEGSGTAAVYSTYINDDYAYMAGTSMACPHAAAICALITASLPFEEVPPETRVAAVRTILYDSCIDLPPPGWDEYFGNGLVNLELTMQNITGRVLATSRGKGKPRKVLGPFDDNNALDPNLLPRSFALRQNYP